MGAPSIIKNLQVLKGNGLSLDVERMMQVQRILQDWERLNEVEELLEPSINKKFLSFESDRLRARLSWQ